MATRAGSTASTSSSMTTEAGVGPSGNGAQSRPYGIEVDIARENRLFGHLLHDGRRPAPRHRSTGREENPSVDYGRGEAGRSDRVLAGTAVKLAAVDKGLHVSRILSGSWDRRVTRATPGPHQCRRQRGSRMWPVQNAARRRLLRRSTASGPHPYGANAASGGRNP